MSAGRPVHLASYDPAWPAAFERLAGRIGRALGDRALLVEHVGSTSVPGLPAKPVIDVVVAVESSADESSYLPALERAGFVLSHREPGWFEHRLLKTADPAPRANVHVFSAGCEEIGRMLAFRDRLRGDEADRRLYEATKRELAKRRWRTVQDYADAKSGIVQEILAHPARPEPDR